MIMKYGQIASGSSINATIYHCFEYIGEEDERKFVKKFQEQSDDPDQIMHTFRELILGAYLISRGFRVRYDREINGKTPDWSILAKEEKVVRSIVELTNFHIDKATKNEIEEQMRVRGMAVYWRDQNKDNVERLYHIIWGKAQAYKSLIKDLQVSYVVGVFGEFEAAVDFEEVCLCLYSDEFGLFGMYPELSGILYFGETTGHYSFNYASNPNAVWTIELPAGNFPSEKT